MANKRSSKQEIEKALNEKSKELGRKPTEGSIYFWLTEIDVHTNTHNYEIARAWREGLQDKKPFTRDDVPDSDIAELREAQRDAAATIEQSYRRIYSTAVEKIRSEAQMRVDAATSRVTDNEVERNFLLSSWRATESELDESRGRLQARAKELEGARLEIAELQGRLYASNDLIGKLTGAAPRHGALKNVHASADAGADDEMGAMVGDDAALAEQHLTNAITPAPATPDPADLPRQPMYGPVEDHDGDSDRVGHVEAVRTDAVSNAGLFDADTDTDHPPAIATPPILGGQIAMPIVDDSTAVEAGGGNDDRG